jgi:hypothetical protein
LDPLAVTAAVFLWFGSDGADATGVFSDLEPMAIKPPAISLTQNER